MAGKEAFLAAGGLALLPPLMDDKDAPLCLHALQVSHAKPKAAREPKPGGCNEGVFSGGCQPAFVILGSSSEANIAVFMVT